MPSPFEDRRKPAERPTSHPADPRERSAERREQERRVWVARSFTSLIVFGLVVLAIILVRRDWTMQSRYMTSLEQYAAVLNTRLKWQREQGWDRLALPAEWDVTEVRPRPPVSFEFYRYYDTALRHFAESRKEPTIIAWADQPIPMMLSSDGRPVAIYDDGRVRVEWLSEAEYNRCFDEQQAELEEAIQKAEQQPVKTR